MTYPTLTLRIAGSGATRRFAIVDANDQPVWHGRFFDNDSHFDTDPYRIAGDNERHEAHQTRGAEASVIAKAIYVGKMVRQARGIDGLLNLVLEGGFDELKALTIDLNQRANAAGVLVKFDPDAGWNEADNLTTGGGYRAAKENDWAALPVTGGDAPTAAADDDESWREVNDFV